MTGDNMMRVSKILVHPIKSCRGSSIQSARYTPEGIEYDRRWCILDLEANCVITARNAPKMVLITPQIKRDDSSPFGGLLTVAFPHDSECEAFSVPLKPTDDILGQWTALPEFVLWPSQGPVDGFICESLGPGSTDSPTTILSKYFEKPVQLIYKGPRPRPVPPSSTFPELKGTALYQDKYPLLLLSEESVDQINEIMQEYVGTQGIDEIWRADKVTIERFRPNIVFQGGGPFIEDNWREITIGSGPTLTLVAKCTRCLLPNISPETGIRDGAVPYKVLTKFRTGLEPDDLMTPCVGCHAVPAGDGIVHVGDFVHVEKSF